MIPADPVFLIGFRACGKSTAGRRLAQQIKYDFADTDELLQKRLGCSIAGLVAQKGWEYFREQESRELISAAAPHKIIATGGGIVLREENRRFMREHGLVFYLQAPAGILAARLSRHLSDAQRPSLTGQNIAEETGEMLRQRTPLYESCAHYCIDTARLLQETVDAMAKAIAGTV